MCLRELQPPRRHGRRELAEGRRVDAFAGVRVADRRAELNRKLDLADEKCLRSRTHRFRFARCRRWYPRYKTVGQRRSRMHGARGAETSLRVAVDDLARRSDPHAGTLQDWQVSAIERRAYALRFANSGSIEVSGEPISTTTLPTLTRQW